MKKLVGLAFVLISVLGVFAASALAAKEQVRCESCGMFWDKSSTRITASIEKDGKATDHYFESLGCLHSKLPEFGAGAKLSGVKVLDYSTVGSKSEKMINGMKAFYLFDTSDLKGSMPVYIAAFSTEDAATKAKSKLGGELLGWKDTWKRLSAAKSGAASCGCKKCSNKGVACDNCPDCKNAGGCECCKDKDKS